MYLKEKATPKIHIFCQCYLKTLHFKVSHSQKFQPLKCKFSLWSSTAKKPTIQTLLHNFEQYSAAKLRFCDVIPCERFPNDFRQAFQLPLWVMDALEPYYFEPNMLQTPKMTAVKITKWITLGKKRHFAALVKDAKSVAGFSPCRQFRVGLNDVT